jgi:hypothetical protein
MRTNSSLIGNERRTSIKLVPDRPGGSAAEVPQSLFGHGGKDRLRRCAAGDQDCQASQRSLSVGELAQFLRGLDVGHVSDLPAVATRDSELYLSAFVREQSR